MNEVSLSIGQALGTKHLDVRVRHWNHRSGAEGSRVEHVVKSGFLNFDWWSYHFHQVAAR